MHVCVGANKSITWRKLVRVEQAKQILIRWLELNQQDIEVKFANPFKIVWRFICGISQRKVPFNWSTELSRPQITFLHWNDSSTWNLPTFLPKPVTSIDKVKQFVHIQSHVHHQPYHAINQNPYKTSKVSLNNHARKLWFSAWKEPIQLNDKIILVIQKKKIIDDQHQLKLESLQ